MRSVSQVSLACLAVAALHGSASAAKLKDLIPNVKAYPNAAARQAVALPMASLPIQDRLNQVFRGQSLSKTKIINGLPAGPADFPWQASLVLAGYKPIDGHFCGASFISDQWLVTAAHCVDNKTSPKMFTVYFGSVDLKNGGTSAKVDKIIVHESWSPQTHDNDIALIRLEKKVSSQPIALITPEDESVLIVPEHKAMVSGWGVTTQGGSLSPVLLKTPVGVVPREVCTNPTHYGSDVTENMICLGDTQADSCQGDSGGPLMFPKDPNFVLAGIVSWGEGCAQPNRPGVYTRVANYGPWVAKNAK